MRGYAILVEEQNTFMHELGHNMGLCLDRNNDYQEDDEWWNPKPLTCMNYFWILYYPDYSSEEWTSLIFNIETNGD